MKDPGSQRTGYRQVGGLRFVLMLDGIQTFTSVFNKYLLRVEHVLCVNHTEYQSLPS